MGVFTRARDSEPSVPESSNVIPLSSRADTSSPRPFATSLPFRANRPLTGAASIVNVSDKKAIAATGKARSASAVTAWQNEAWAYYDEIGELKFAFQVVGNVMSRMRLYTARLTADVRASGSPPSPISSETYKNASERERRLSAAAVRALDGLDSAYGGQSGLLRDASLNLSIPGECYLVQVPKNEFSTPPRDESWDIRSTNEVVMSPEGETFIRPKSPGNSTSMMTARPDPSNGDIVLPKNAFVARIWRAHPRYSGDPDSSMRGVLDLCNELLLLNRTARSTARSRLNAGAMYLPDGLSASSSTSGIDPTEPAETGAPGTSGDLDTAGSTPTETSDDDEFEESLIEAMTQPIIDEESTSAVVPILIRGPAELGEKIKQFKFERSFDPALAQRADRVLERILQGIDVPKDIVTGLANVRYNNAFQIEQQLYKAHVEPLTLMLCDALTVAYLRPVMKSLVPDATVEELRKYVVWYDPSGVTTTPNREEDANQGYDRGIISASAWRRAHSFNDDDKPTPDELALRLLLDRAAVTPELTESLLVAFAPQAMKKVREATQQANPAAQVDPAVAEALGLPPQTTPENPQAQAPPPPAPPASPASPDSLPDQINPQDLL